MPRVMRRHVDIIDLSQELQSSTAILQRESFAVCSPVSDGDGETPSAAKRTKIEVKNNEKNKVPDRDREVEVLGMIQRNAITGQPVVVLCQNPATFDTNGQEWKPYVSPTLTALTALTARNQLDNYLPTCVMTDRQIRSGKWIIT